MSRTCPCLKPRPRREPHLPLCLTPALEPRQSVPSPRPRRHPVECFASTSAPKRRRRSQPRASTRTACLGIPLGIQDEDSPGVAIHEEDAKGTTGKMLKAPRGRRCRHPRARRCRQSLLPRGSRCRHCPRHLRWSRPLCARRSGMVAHLELHPCASVRALMRVRGRGGACD